MSGERDAHLLAALRHAPDHDAVPPPEVTRRILAAARDAVRPVPPSVSTWQRLGAWWLRPQVGAAFATLAVATLLGVMWSTHEPPVPASAPTVVDVAPAPGAAVVPPPPVASAPAAAPVPVERQAAKAERRRAPAPETRARSAAEALPTPVAPAVPVEPLAKSADAVAPPPPPAPAPAAAPAMRLRTERAAANELGALAGGQAAAAPATSSLADKTQAFDPLQALEAMGGTGAWTWRASGVDGERAHGEPQRALWAALRPATQGRWVQATAQPPLAPWLVLRHGSHSTTLWFMDGALYVTDAQRRTWRAPVSAEQARDWQQAVGSW